MEGKHPLPHFFWSSRGDRSSANGQGDLRQNTDLQLMTAAPPCKLLGSRVPLGAAGAARCRSMPPCVAQVRTSAAGMRP